MRLIFLSAFLLLQAPASTPAPTIVQINLDDVVHPVSADYIKDGLNHAKDINARAVVLRLDTPGGLIDSMRDIVEAILASPVPVITWGNGTCAQPEGYGSLLRYIASYGYFIVAANSREVGTGGPLTKGLDFAQAANKDPSSPYYGHLDMTKVGVMGHSQGAGIF